MTTPAPKVQTPAAPAPGSTAPQTEAGLTPGTDGSDAPKSALEVLALAGDEAARRALGQPTAGAPAADLTAKAGKAGFRIGEPAPRDVFVAENGKVVSDVSKLKGGFRGTQAAIKGSTVTAATLTALQAAGEL